MPFSKKRFLFRDQEGENIPLDILVEQNVYNL